MSVVSTDSTNTLFSEENSNSSSWGRTSFTAQHCRPLRPPAERFSGYLSHPHEKIDSHAAYAATQSGPEPDSAHTVRASGRGAKVYAPDTLIDSLSQCHDQQLLDL